jgi:hypothetical protein
MSAIDPFYWEILQQVCWRGLPIRIRSLLRFARCCLSLNCLPHYALGEAYGSSSTIGITSPLTWKQFTRQVKHSQTSGSQN